MLSGLFNRLYRKTSISMMLEKGGQSKWAKNLARHREYGTIEGASNLIVLGEHGSKTQAARTF
jgi:hypothetical protein